MRTSWIYGIGEEDPQNAVGNYVLENNAWKKKESPPEKSLELVWPDGAGAETAEKSPSGEGQG